MPRLGRPLAAAVAAVLLAGACSGGGSGGGTADLVVYSGRAEGLVGALIQRFEEQSDLDVEVRYGDSAELAAQLLEEGDDRKADVFFSQDAGALGALQREGALGALPADVTGAVPAKYRSPQGRWVGVSGRARVIVYNPRRVSEEELPASVYALAEPAWRGRVGIAPTNASFQAFVTAMRIVAGEQRTRQWLEGIKANARPYERNNLIVEAVDTGEIDVGLVNHYYLHERIKEKGAGDVVARNHYLAGGDPGALVNVAGAGVVEGTARQEAALRFVRFLLSADAQRYFAEETSEYPMVSGVQPVRGLPPLARIEGPDIDLADLASLQETLALLSEVGLT